jgi:RND family efflux transporter MFP subunit
MMKKEGQARRGSLSVAGALMTILAAGAGLTAASALYGCSTRKSGAGQDAQTSAQAAPQGAVAKVAVSAIQPQRKAAKGELLLNGTLHARDEVDVVAETQGKILKLYVDTGSRVARGDVLAQIDDELKQSSYKIAQVSYDKSKSDYGKCQELFAQKVISDSDLQASKLAFASAEAQLLQARKDLENAKVRSPQAGVVTQRFVSVGSMIAGGARVAHVVDSDDLKLAVQVGEQDILKIRVGQPVAIESDQYPGSPFSGAVSALSPKGDAAMSFPVEIALRADPKRPLYDGMSAKARIAVAARTILAIPRTCVVGSFQSPQVYVVVDGVARLRSIAAGSEYGTDIEVLSGLDDKDIVVSSGTNNLSDGSAVEIEGGSYK